MPTTFLKQLLQEKESSDFSSLRSAYLTKQQGLRNVFLQQMNKFIAEALVWDIQRQRQFTDWLLTACEREEDVHELLIHPLNERLLKPVLKQWMNDLPEDVRPYRWFGIFFFEEDNSLEYLQTAIDRGGPQEQLAIETMIRHLLNWLWYAFHHLNEDLYLSETEDDAETLKETRLLIDQLDDSVQKTEFMEEWQEHARTYELWLRFLKEETEGFMEWRERQEKQGENKQ
ncbi:hypothetical protein QK289_08865 [Exiguobacterium antarcticum]|uniref:Uncharacterized protein n=1 Tax=Exiguobacterium antarcticum TaxID=132920 RepID=A0ABT6R2E0_9BACL|nr:hypothetical protein [Exiguobacterium antarcticum]MDI3235114.1 hypothetical protein [Exiguobacterium antarcticum]